MSDWFDDLGTGNEHLGPQFHAPGDGAFSPGHHFEQYTEFHTAPYTLEMPYTKDINSAQRAPGHVKDHAELTRVNPRLAARAVIVQQGNPLKIGKDERGRTRINTNNGWGNRQNMN